VSEHAPVDAGPFSTWLDAIREVLRDEGTSDVPCGGCTACCTSSQFVHIAPDEEETLARIPRALLFPAPRLPAGHVLMGYDDDGRCPMLVDGACSIYEHRPRACRAYDCRVFAASGLELEGPEKSAVNERVRRWRFRLPDAADRDRLGAVRSAAAHLGELEPGRSVTERTLEAIEIADRFLSDTADTDDA